MKRTPIFFEFSMCFLGFLEHDFFDEFFLRTQFLECCDFQTDGVSQPAQRQISKDLKEQEDIPDVEDEPDKVETEVATISTQTEEVKPPTPEAEESPELEARETQVSVLSTYHYTTRVSAPSFFTAMT